LDDVTHKQVGEASIT